MKNAVCYFFIICIALSCSDNTTDTEIDVAEIPGKGQISISQKDFIISQSDTTFKISFSSNSSWEAISEASWITIDELSGEKGKNQEITLNIKENSQEVDRIGYVILQLNFPENDADTITISQMGNTPYVNIDWDKTDIISFNQETGDIELNFGSGKIPHIIEKRSIVYVPTDTCGYLRKIKNAKYAGNMVTLQTIGANMTDVFHDQEFILSTKMEDTALLARGHSVMTEKRVLYPSRIVAIDNNNNVHVLFDDKELNTRSIAIEASKTFFRNDTSFTNKSLLEWEHSRLYWKKCDFGANLNANIYFKFGGEDVEIGDDIKQKIRKGKLEDFSFTLDGNVYTDINLAYEASREFAYEGDPVSLCKFNSFKITFPTTPPIVISVKVELLSQVSLAVKGNVEISGGFNASLDMKAGIHYSPESKLSPVISVDKKHEIYRPKIEGKASCNLKINVYPKIRIGIYDLLGPYFALKPYIQNEFEVGAMEQIGNPDNYLGWTNDFETGMDADFGLFLNFIGNEMELPPISFENVFRTPLHKNPTQIKLLSPSSGTKCEAGQPVNVTFKATGYNYITNKDEDCFGAVVKIISSNGNSFISISNGEGKVETTWTPTRNGDFIDAALIDAKGDIISTVRFLPKIEENNTSLIIGTWETYKLVRYSSATGQIFDITSPYPSTVREFHIFNSDGTYYQWDTDAAAWPYGNYSVNGNILHISYPPIISDVPYAMLKIKSLTSSELVLDPIPLQPAEDYLIGKIFLKRITDQTLIDKINAKIKNSPFFH